MQFPYGLSDFATLIEAGYFYQDRAPAGFLSWKLQAGN